MKIEIIKCLQDNYSYLLIDEENNYSCVIDPSESKPIINFIENRIKEIEEGIKSLGVQKNDLIQQYNNTRSTLNNLVQQGNKNVR